MVWEDHLNLTSDPHSVWRYVNATGAERLQLPEYYYWIDYYPTCQEAPSLWAEYSGGNQSQGVLLPVND